MSLGKFMTSIGSPYIHYKWTPEEETQVSIPDTYQIYRQQKANFMKTIKNNFNTDFKNTKYNDVFELLDELTLGLNSQNILNEASKGIHTSGERLNLFTADGATVSRSFESLRYYGSNNILFQEVDGELKNLKIYTDALENILTDSKIIFNTNAISEIAEEIMLQQAIANKTGEKLHSAIMNQIIKQALDKNQGKILALGKSTQLANFERFAAQLAIYKQVINGLSSSANIGSNKNFIQNIAYQIGITISRLGGFLYEPVVADMVNLAEEGVFSTIEAESGKSAGKMEVNIPKSRQKRLKTQKVVTTEDVQFYYKQTETGGEASLKVQLPGASIKAIAYNPSARRQTVHIQTGTTLGEVILRSNIDIKRQYLIANTLIHKAANSKMGQDIRDYIAARNILNALAGTLNRGDASYFLIVNNKAFTVPQILDECARKGGSINAKISLSGIQGIQNKNYFAEGELDDERSNRVWASLRAVNLNTLLMIQNILFTS